jgi:hypothetical protein
LGDVLTLGAGVSRPDAKKSLSVIRALLVELPADGGNAFAPDVASLSTSAASGPAISGESPKQNGSPGHRVHLQSRVKG